MKLTKIIFASLTLAIFLTLPAAWTQAQEDSTDCEALFRGNPLKIEQCKNLQQVGQKSYGNVGLGEEDPSLLANRAGRVISLVLSAFGVVFLGLVVFSGIQWMTAGGNEEKVSNAQKRIMRAAIGLGIIVMAWAMTSFIITRIQQSPDEQQVETEQ